MARARFGWRRRAAIVGLAALLTACSSSPVAQPTASGIAAAPSLDLSAAIKPGPADPSLVQLVRASIPVDAQAAGPAGAALTTADRAEVNAAVVVDPSIPEIQAALDSTLAAGAQQLEAKLSGEL